MRKRSLDTLAPVVVDDGAPDGEAALRINGAALAGVARNRVDAGDVHRFVADAVVALNRARGVVRVRAAQARAAESAHTACADRATGGAGVHEVEVRRGVARVGRGAAFEAPHVGILVSSRSQARRWAPKRCPRRCPRRFLSKARSRSGCRRSSSGRRERPRPKNTRPHWPATGAPSPQ